MTFDELKGWLPGRLDRPLPGTEGQVLMSPRPRFGWRPGEVPEDARPSGVLLLVYPVDDAPHLVLTVRNDTLPHHAGQVSLPGGAAEPGESIEGAALRETHEEVGLEPDRVRMIGALSRLHVPVSGYVLHPRVAFTDDRPVWRPDRREVARVVEVSLESLRDPGGVEVEVRQHADQPVDVPFFRLDGEKVWGATAMVLAEFLCVMGSPPDPWGAAGGR